MELLKVVEYKSSACEKWYVTGAIRAGWKWRYIPNMLKLDCESYIKVLRSYKATDIIYKADTDCLLYSFDTKENAHKWVLYVNRKAREINYQW